MYIYIYRERERIQEGGSRKGANIRQKEQGVSSDIHTDAQAQDSLYNTHVYDKIAQLDVCIFFSGGDMGMNITAQGGRKGFRSKRDTNASKPAYDDSGPAWRQRPFAKRPFGPLRLFVLYIYIYIYIYTFVYLVYLSIDRSI